MPRSVLMMPAAVDPIGDDVLYLIQGSGVGRDRKVTAGALLSGKDDGSGDNALIANLPLPTNLAPDHADYIILGRGASSRKGLMAKVEDVILAGLPEAIFKATTWDLVTTRDNIKYPFSRMVLGSDNPGPDPEEPTAQAARLRHLAEAFGAPHQVIITEPGDSGNPTDLDPAGSYGEGGWRGTLYVVIQNTLALTPSSADILIYTTGALPPNSVVTIVSNEAGSKRGSTYNLYLIIGGQTYIVCKGEMLLLFTGDAGAVLATRYLPKMAAGSPGSAAIWDYLYSIQGMSSAQVETPWEFPAGNPTYPYPLIDLAEKSGSSATGGGAGVRCAGNVGVELAQADSDPGNSKYRKVSRIYFHQDGSLVWDKGKDSLGNVLGKYDLNQGMVEQFEHYQIGLPNPAVGGWGGNYSTVANSFHFPWHFIQNKCATYKSVICIHPDTNLLLVGETIDLSIEMWRIPENGTASVLQTKTFQIVGAAGNQGYYLAEIDWTAMLIYPKTGIWFKTAVTARSGTTNVGLCDVSITTRFRQVARD